MIIGEGPGHYEVAKNTPFVGPAGRYLTAFLEYAGIDRDACYITNATLCLPRLKEKSLHQSYPTAIPACLSRLEEEIEEVRPRVIITLGAAALIAVTGYDKPIQRRRDRNCTVCNEKRRVGPVIQCSKCGHNHWFDALSKDAVDPDVVKAVRQEPCPTCTAKRSNLRPKMIKCPVCKGRKTETYTEYVFTHDYKISEVAGAIFVPGEEGKPLDSHELQPWYGECGVKYVIGTYHPSFIQRGNQFYAEVVVKHLARARWLLTHDVDFDFEWSITSDPDEVRRFCDPGELSGKGCVSLSLDIETEAWGTDEEGKPVQLDAREIELVTHIKCIGIERDGKALVVDTRNVDPDDREDPLLDALYDILVDSTYYKTYQNGMCYDIPVIDLVWGIPWDEQIDSYTDDTLTAYHALYPDEPSNLAHITFAMTRQRAWKPPRNVKGVEVHADFNELALYNARDVINTGSAKREMGVKGGVAIKKGLMDREGLSKVYEIDSQLNRIAVTMTMHGMSLDAEQWAQAGTEAKRRIEEGIQQARDALAVINFPRAEEFNPFKTANDLVPALYNTEGFNFAVTKRTAAGQPTTDKNTIIDLMSQASSVGSEEGIRFLKALTEIRDSKKTLSTYIEGQRPWSDGRLHYQWKPYGTKTGRFSSSPNAQNFPGWIKQMIVAPEGRMICGADYSQLELRALAALAGDSNLIHRCLTADESRKLEPEYDPHSYIASIVFRETFTELALDNKKRSDLRTAVKSVIYGLNYGAGDQKTVATIYGKGYDGPPITVEFVRHVRRAVFSEFREIPKWQEEQIRISTENAELRSPIHGRRRVFPCNDQQAIPITETKNYPIQSIAADLMNEATILLWQRLPDVDPTAFLFAQVHDAIYVESDENKADQVCRLIEECLTTTRAFRGPEMVFNAAAKASKSWKEAG